jgi:hypothetical protein
VNDIITAAGNAVFPSLITAMSRNGSQSIRAVELELSVMKANQNDIHPLIFFGNEF